MALAILVVSVATSGAPSLAQKRGAEAGEPLPPPNLVVIMTDDQLASTMKGRFMPQTRKLLARAGTTFKNFVATTPICCPSRAGFYTGQYSHNNGVFTNHGGYGDLRAPGNVLPVWLREAGYRTALVGKFMHGYAEDPATDSPATPAPGYTEWQGLLSNNYYGYRLSENGKVIRYRHRPKDYATSVINDRVADLIQAYGKREAPFFIHVSHVAPHSDRAPGTTCDHAAIPAPRDLDLYGSLRFGKTPSFGEEDVSDKPSFVQRLPRLKHDEVRKLRRRYRCRVASLREVDRGVRRVVNALERAGELDETAIALTGDNGYFLGEHRQRRGKGLPYEESIRQPLVMRVPLAYRNEEPRVKTVGATTANIDLAPTLLDLARAEPCDGDGECRTLDGRSLMPLLERRPFPQDRGVLIEYTSKRGSGRKTDEGGTCRYHAIRVPEVIYVEHTSVVSPQAHRCVNTLEVEHYDLRSDPFEVQNLYPPRTGERRREQERLAVRLENLRGCVGTRPGDSPDERACE
jgi:N-acetylglucosamine-6-sulfatase